MLIRASIVIWKFCYRNQERIKRLEDGHIGAPPKDEQAFVPSVLETRDSIYSAPMGSRTLEASAAGGTGHGPIMGSNVEM